MRHHVKRDRWICASLLTSLP